MKTTLSVLALVMALAPSLTQAGVIMSDPLIDSISEAEITPSDQVNDALEDAVNGGPVYSEPINDLILDGLEDGHRRGVSIRTGAMLKCVVRGFPVAYPDDLRIRNAGAVALPAGTQLKWRVAAAEESGFVTLGKTLQPGAALRLEDVLDDGVAAGSKCAVSVR